MYCVELLCLSCIVNVLIHLTNFVTPVVNLPQSRREYPLALKWRRHANYISAVELGIRTRAGHHIHAKIDVRNIYFAGSLALTKMPFAVPMIW